ncbi:hypothetical protein PTTG_27859, partial [Puccinia triticina 1-1 BBBD Race 1]
LVFVSPQLLHFRVPPGLSCTRPAFALIIAIGSTIPARPISATSLSLANLTRQNTLDIRIDTHTPPILAFDARANSPLIRCPQPPHVAGQSLRLAFCTLVSSLDPIASSSSPLPPSPSALVFASNPCSSSFSS